MAKDKDVSCCPKCGSTSISTSNKKLNMNRAFIGGVLAGGIGAIIGGTTRKKIKCVCLTCGHKWKV